MPTLTDNSFQVITIGSAVVDVFVHTDFQTKSVGVDLNKNPGGDPQQVRFNFGDKLDVEKFRVYSGGGATNTAVGFSRLGLRAATICETGSDDFSQIVINDLKREKVATELVISEKLEQTGGSIVVVGNRGERVITTYRGAASQLDPFDIPTFWLSKASWIHLSNIAARQLTLDKIFSIVRRERQIGLSWNPGKGELKLLASGQLLGKDLPVEILILNDQEWAIVEPLQAELLKTIPQIVVTRGIQGGEVYLNGQKRLQYPGGDVSAVDRTGAGDAFATGYVGAQILKRQPMAAVEWGMRNAISVIRHYGAKPGLLRREQLDGKS